MSGLVEDFWSSLSEETGAAVPASLEEEFRLVEKSEKGWDKLLDFIQSETMQGSCGVSELNQSLIRSGSPIWDKSRVLLSKTDFIDASHVILPQVSRHYILTQSPLLDTIQHFWEMVWQLDIHCILMLNQFNEKFPAPSLAESSPASANQIHAYLPTGVEHGDTDQMECGDYVIKYECKEVYSSFDLTQLTITDRESGVTRTLQHFSFCSWSPNVQVSPITRSDNLLDFLFQLYSRGVYAESSLSATSQPFPVLLHCSDGLGRSGGFLLLDYCLQIITQTESHKGVKIPELVRELRGQRRGLITDGDQLRAVYISLLTGARKLATANQMAEVVEVVRSDTADSDDESVDLQMQTSVDPDSSDDDFELVNKPVYSSSDAGQDSGSGEQLYSMDKYITPEDAFQSDPLISTQENLGLPIESDQLVSHSEPVPSVAESESTQIEDTPNSANQATEEASVTPEIEKVSEGLEGDGRKAPPLTDRFYSISADTETTSERKPADTESPPEGKPADTESPPEGKSADTESPPEGKSADTESPPEGKSADTESPPEGKPADTESPPEGKSADTGINRKTAGEETHVVRSEGVTKRTYSTPTPLPSETPPVSLPSPQPVAKEHSLQSISIFIYLLLPVFAVSFLILILYFLI